MWKAGRWLKVQPATTEDADQPCDVTLAEGKALKSTDSGGGSGARCLLSLFGGFCATLAVGAVFGWGAIARQLGDHGYSLDDKLVMGTMSTLSVYLTLHAGVFFDKHGARISLSVGLVLTVGGWLLTRWGITHRQPAAVVGCYLAITSQGVQPCVLAALDNVRNFPAKWHGICNAVVTTGFGLTGIAIAQVSQDFFDHDLPGLLLFMAAATAVLLLFQLVVFVPPLPVPCSDGAPVDALSHLSRLCRSTDAHLFGGSMFCFGMSLFLFVVNVADLATAAESKHSASALVTAFGVCNVAARPAVGFLSDLIPFTRAQLLALGLLLAATGMLLLGMQQMLPAALMMGFCDGYTCAVWVPLTREIHGTQNYGLTFASYLGILGLGDFTINFVLGKTVLPLEATAHIFQFDLFVSASTCALLMPMGMICALCLHNRLVQRPANGHSYDGVLAQ